MYFQKFTAVDAEQDKTIEALVRRTFEYAGCLDFDFDSLEDDFSTLNTDIWNTGDATGTWEIESGRMKGTGGGDAQWYYLPSVGDVVDPTGGITKRNFVVQFTKDGDKGLFGWRDNTGGQHYALCWWTDKTILYLHQNTSDTILLEVAHTFPGQRTITISQRDHWISVWIDGWLLGTVYNETLKSAGRFMLGVYGSDVVYFDDLRVPELTEVIDYTTLDPGEPPAACLSRILGRRHIKFFMRYDDTLRMWRPKDVDSAYTYDSNVAMLGRDFNQPVLASHVRVVGATDQADEYDRDLAKVIGHAFRKLDDPDLMTMDEAKDEAEYYMDLVKSEYERVSIEIPAQVLQEIEDKVTITQGEVDGDYLVDNFSITLSPAERGAALKAQLYVRKAV